MNRCQISDVRKIFFLSSVFCFLSSLCFAQPLSSTELINNAKLYDGKTVVYEGEVIGDIMKRGEFAWLNLNDGVNAIGVWLPVPLVEVIAYQGSYKAKGDWLEVTGAFQRACAEHGGDLDIHAFSVKKTVSGRLVNEKLIPGKKNIALVLSIILFLVWILKILKRK